MKEKSNIINKILFEKRKLSIFIILIFLFLPGCNLGYFSEPAGKSDKSTGSTKSNALYLDFEDILIPTELKRVTDKTTVVATPGFTFGVLALKGMVDSNSLFNFFISNMQRDNWSGLSQFKSGEITIMVFRKKDKCAVINIREKKLYTYVEIGVAPTITESMNSSVDVKNRSFVINE